ncbi:hypothetical protein LS684_11920 [Cytobacillus spongiae]|uniref:hypothetical protein n=1 Tax=Cytobacillus spongiae TaxID=2901381 RepID=UPI001F1F210D|nr:hypothetical protein [Cytobacillus spongiae]UII58017.1 hypothetical protein LS684_11920 [Cytobacillus spongiae]
MSKQGKLNQEQSGKQLRNRAERNEVELGSEFQLGNDQGQSQKKSGRQKNKK